MLTKKLSLCTFIFMAILSIQSVAFCHIPCGIIKQETPIKKNFSITKTAINYDLPINNVSAKNIRVLLSEQKLIDKLSFTLTSTKGLLIKSPIELGITTRYANNQIKLICHNNHLYICLRDGKYSRIKPDSIEIAGNTNEININDSPYHGSIIIHLDKKNKKAQIINKLHLEDYIYSVIRHESLPYWPHDMQKLQAIISRSYAVSLMTEARTNNRAYDIKNTNFHQVYNGIHECEHLRKAIDATEHLVIVHNQKIARTMFDICCGGSIPFHMKDQDKTKPYLYRKQPCKFCSSSKNFHWKQDLYSPTFLSMLKTNNLIKKKIHKLGKSIQSIDVTEKDDAGIVHQLTLMGKNNNHIILTGNDLKLSLPGTFKSLDFSIKKIRDRIVIYGKGWGHQRGLCQLGAKKLVDKGWGVKKILQFYYPGTKVGRLV